MEYQNCRIVVPKRRLGMRLAKRRLANPIRGNESGNGRGVGDAKPRFAGRIPKRRLGTTVSPPRRHSGIFIPPACVSGIAALRWRNENACPCVSEGPESPPTGGRGFPSESRPAGAGDSGHFHPARLHPSRPLNIPPARDENSGMTTGVFTCKTWQDCGMLIPQSLYPPKIRRAV